MAVVDLLRQHGISKVKFFNWRSEYGGASMANEAAARVDAENAKLKSWCASTGRQSSASAV